MEHESIERLNELAAKAKAEGLSETEKAEQADLREQYLAAIRRNFRAQLENIEIVDGTGKEEQ